MSIFASLAAPNCDHRFDDLPMCARYVESPPGSGCYEFGDKPCDCGLPDAPLRYQGSHILPSDDDERGGEFDLALIPGHIERLPDRPALNDGYGPPWPYLRFGLSDADGGDATVILRPAQARQIRDTLTAWLDSLADTQTGADE